MAAARRARPHSRLLSAAAGDRSLPPPRRAATNDVQRRRGVNASVAPRVAGRVAASASPQGHQQSRGSGQRRASQPGWDVVAPRQAAPTCGDGDGGAKESGRWRRRHIVRRACIAMCSHETEGGDRGRAGNASCDLTNWGALGRSVLASECRRFFISLGKRGKWLR